jgi:hypothetical protein
MSVVEGVLQLAVDRGVVLFRNHWTPVAPVPQLAFSSAWLPDTETTVTSHGNAQAAALAVSPSISMARAASLISLWDTFMFNPRIYRTAFATSL